MFYYLSGEVTILDKNLAVIDANGVGYQCITSQNTVNSLQLGAQARLYTYLYVKEDVFEIYGFSSLEELSIFKHLISVSGIGPKAGISILSALSVSDFLLALYSEDEKAFSTAPGIGKRTAQRIILELKEKISKENIYSSGDPIASGTPVKAVSNEILDSALEALVSLGFNRSESLRAIQGINPEDKDLEAIIKEALINLTSNKGFI